MLLLVGFCICVFCIIFGSWWMGGGIYVLWQLGEIIIVLGAGLGFFIASNSYERGLALFHSFKRMFKNVNFTSKLYTDLLCSLYKVAVEIESKGIISLESHIEDYQNSSLFNNNKILIQNKEAMGFICDSLRIIIVDSAAQSKISEVMDKDMRAKTTVRENLTESLLVLADIMPAIGLLGAVLEMIHAISTVSHPENLGLLVAAALTGTFLGVFSGYSILMPCANSLSIMHSNELEYLNCIKIVLSSYLSLGYSPIFAVEVGRRSLQSYKPTFYEVEKAILRY